MNSTEVVAIIGAGSTVGVEVAGYVFNYLTARREADAQLARDAQQCEHERELARGGRLFDRRAPVYEEMLRFLNVWRDRVDATEPVWQSAGDPGPPEPPNFEEWRAMQARLGTFGSGAVSDAYRKYWKALEGFYERVHELRMISRATRKEAWPMPGGGWRKLAATSGRRCKRLSGSCSKELEAL